MVGGGFMRDLRYSKRRCSTDQALTQLEQVFEVRRLVYDLVRSSGNSTRDDARRRVEGGIDNNRNVSGTRIGFNAGRHLVTAHAR